MRFNTIIRSTSSFVERLFHKRSIIVISEHQTNHFAISARTQYISIALIAFAIGGASYVTGSYMATKSVLEEKDETLKSVANSRIETNFQRFGPTFTPENFAPVSQAAPLPLTDPSYTFTAVDQDKLVARIAFLETKVRELKNTNTEIIQVVREKTKGRIADLESVIKKTGLDPKQLQATMRNNEDETAAKIASKNAPQGGPFIPDDINEDLKLPADLFVPIDHLNSLSSIVETLPLAMPIQNASTNSIFGRRIDPINGTVAFHPGVDLAGPPGSKIHATNTGRVISAGYNGAYGNMVDIDHGNGIVTRYGHMSQITVRAGQEVAKNQVIGVEGSTGRSTGTHLHYEVRYNGQPINPVNFLKAGAYVSQN